MKTIKIIIEKSADAYDAYAENVYGVSGAGNTVEQAKQNVLKSIEILKTFPDSPKILQGEYKIAFKFDTQSLLQNYKDIFSTVSFEKLTGINQKQIHHYITGHNKPREAQKRKITHALHQLGKELLAIEIN